MPSSSATSVTSVVEHYMRKMERHESEPNVLGHALDKLDRVKGVSIAVLQETGIGRAVNALKRHQDLDVSAKAKALVAKWKDLVTREEEEEEEQAESGQDAHEEPSVEHKADGENLADNSDGESKADNGSLQRSSSVKSKSSSQSHRSHSHKHKDKRQKEPSEDDDEKRSRRKKDEEKKSGSSRPEEVSHHKHSHSSRHEHHRDRSKSSSKSKHREEGDSSSTKHKSGGSSREHKHSSSKPSENNGHQREHGHSSSKRDHESSKSSSHRSSSQSQSKSSESAVSSRSPEVKQTNGHSSHSNSASKIIPPPAAAKAKSTSSTSSSLSIPSDISPNYKPLPQVPVHKPRKPMGQTEDEALSALIAMKGLNRTAVYSGTKRSGYKIGSEVPSLYQLCIEVLQDHVDDIEECGGLGYNILGPVLERAGPSTLARIEEFNQYLMADTGPLWERIVQRHFPKAQREEMESPREMYERCLRERDEKLESLKRKVTDSYKREESAVKKAKLAYVDTVAKAPRNIRNAQAKNGTGLPVGHPMKRVVGPPIPSPASSSAKIKPKIAPLMSKTLKMARGMKVGFRR